MACIGLALAGEQASGAPLFRLSWDTCNPLVSHKVVAPGTIASLVGSVTGQDQVHGGYTLMLTGHAAASIPDAWQFDDDGCQPYPVIIDYIVVTAIGKVCPTFSQFGPVSVQERTFDYDATSGSVRAALAIRYPTVLSSNPATRYFTLRILFDHTDSVSGGGTPGVTCGGLESLITFDVERAVWINAANEEVPWPLENDHVTAAGVPPVPALDRTWGQIKSIYRQ